MWTLNPLADFEKRLEKYKKKWEHELTNVLDNLDTFFKALKTGTRPEQLKQLGFVHTEPLGLLAIDQKGPGKGSKLKPFRLYVYPDEETKTLHILTIGDKDTQTEDISQSKSFVQGLLKSKAAAAKNSTDSD